MALTPEQIQQFRQQYGLTSTEPIQEEERLGFFGRVKEDLFKEAKYALGSIERGAELFAQKDILGGVARAGLGTTGAAVRALFSPVTEAIAPIIKPTIETALGGEETQKFIQKIDSWSQQHPDAASNLKDIFDIITVAGATKTAAIGTRAVAPAVERAAITGLEKGVAPLGRVVSAVGKEAFEAGVGISAKEAPLVQVYKANFSLPQRIAAAVRGEPLPGKPRIAAETGIEQILGGTESMIGVQSLKAARNIWSQVVGPALKQAKEPVNMQAFFDGIESKIIKETKELSRRKDLLEGLEALREDFKDIGFVRLEQLQEFKEGWARFVPEKAYKGKPIAGSFNDVRNIASGEARNRIYGALGKDIKQAYLDYGNLKGLQEFGQKAMTGGKFKGGFGGFISALKDLLVVPVATIGGKTVYKAGRGLEFIGETGAKKLGDILPIKR